MLIFIITNIRFLLTTQVLDLLTEVILLLIHLACLSNLSFKFKVYIRANHNFFGYSIKCRNVCTKGIPFPQVGARDAALMSAVDLTNF